MQVKKGLVLSILFLTIIILCQALMAKDAVIRGQIRFIQTKINTSDNKRIQLGIPIDGIYYNDEFFKDIKVDASGIFEINFVLRQPSIVPVKILDEIIQIYIEPNAEVNLDIEVNNGSITLIKDVGKLSLENNFLLNKLNERGDYHFKLVQDAQKFKYLSRNDQLLFLANVEKYKNYYLKSLDSLKIKNGISGHFSSLAKNVLTYYAIVLPFHQLINTNVHPLKLKDSLFYNSVIDTFQTWTGELDSTMLSMPLTLYLEIFSNLKGASNAHTNSFDKWIVLKERALLPSPFDRLSIYQLLVYQYKKGFPLPINFSEAVETYLQTYPFDGLSNILDSLNITIFDKPIRYTDSDMSLPDRLRTYKFYIEKGVPTIGYFKEFQSLKHLLSTSLRKEIVFIDFWATWCEPCLDEFHFSKQLRDSLYERDIHLIYFSIDNIEKLHQWENMAGTQQLDGEHVLLSNKLLNKIKDQLDIKTIPRYILATSDGKILIQNANKPSELSSLLEEIDLKLREIKKK